MPMVKVIAPMHRCGAGRRPFPQRVTPDPRGLIMFKAVIFDFDGTILDSQYDWKGIREDLGLKQYSLLDQLYSLPEKEREKTERLLKGYERHATVCADLFPGVRQVLESLKEKRIKRGLLTNNSYDNVVFITEKFDLIFDSIMTRDDGMWKPKKEPVLAITRNLGVSPQETLLVGDSDYDIISARSAGTSCAILERGKSLQETPDYVLENLWEINRLMVTWNYEG